MTLGTHGTTYGGNPLAMACGNAVLDVVLSPGFLEDVARKGLLLRQQLAGLAAAYPEIITEIRGEGLIQGLKLTVPPADFAAAARAKKLIVIPAGDNVARILPPLIVSDEEIRIGVERLAEACVAVRTAKEPEQA
jgi:acetylornithine/N-succinyldiaminopimelate aminotransferase